MGNGMVQYNGWLCYDGYRYHTGTNANFSSLILVDKERDIGIFSVSNIWTYTADYAGNSLYQAVKGEQINRQQFERFENVGLKEMGSTRLLYRVSLPDIL